MKKISASGIKYVLILLMVLLMSTKGIGQTTMPEELIKNTFKEQMKYLEERTRIYQEYRAIREDMFQKIKRNALDTLSAAKTEIAGLKILKNKLNYTIDSVNASLDSTQSQLEEITRTKNNIKVFGLEVNKITYNTLMWLLVTGLVALLVFGFLAFKRNISVTTNLKKELKDLKDEFEAYRKTSREAREKMSMEHFNELKKLRGGS
ncbi:MAG: hypothetical protein MUO72_08390 [Bacteroidales bacterium]|nr:hypothetical protein [Bacteroidales bacterium]